MNDESNLTVNDLRTYSESEFFIILDKCDGRNIYKYISRYCFGTFKYCVKIEGALRFKTEKYAQKWIEEHPHILNEPKIKKVKRTFAIES